MLIFLSPARFSISFLRTDSDRSFVTFPFFFAWGTESKLNGYSGYGEMGEEKKLTKNKFFHPLSYFLYNSKL